MTESETSPIVLAAPDAPDAPVEPPARLQVTGFLAAFERRLELATQASEASTNAALPR